jgi:hypothetical protein
MSRKQKIIIGVLIGIIVVGIILSVWLIVRAKTSNKTTVPVKFSNTQVECKLDGTNAPKELANRRPLAIMVENHPEARPQVGLDKASIIYEAIAEGGITRFMAVYGPRDADKVGPVRSARVYYVDWSEEYNALYAHAGGAQNALTKIVEDNVPDLNHNTTAFWRQNDGRALEHTLYTTTKKLYEYAVNQKFDINTSDFTPQKFKSDLSADQRTTAQGAVINFSTDTYKVEWKYDKEKNMYLRNMAGSPHNDEATKQQLTTKNVVIQVVSRSPVESAGKTVYEMNTVGSGEATVLMDGKSYKGTWKKDKAGHTRTMFYDDKGKQISFNRGVTWIEVVNPDAGSYSVQ